MNNELIRVNGTEIACPIENGEAFVAIRPICQLLSIDTDFQVKKIKNDEILGQLPNVAYVVVAADGKNRKLFCLPVKYVFGWLFSISSEKVSAKAKPNFIRFKQECYDALFNHFYGPAAQRKQALLRGIDVKAEMDKLEEELESDERFKRLNDLKAEYMRMGKELKSLDREVVQAAQIQLFGKA